MSTWSPGARHGSPEWSAATGTVHAELVAAWVSGLVPSPKKYRTPSGVVTFQYSPLSSPLVLSVRWRRSTNQPGSSLSRQRVCAESTGISSPAWPLSEIVALSFFQHRSPEPIVSWHEV